LRIRDQGVYREERINQNADDADGRGSSRIKPKRPAPIRSIRVIRVLLTRTPVWKPL